MSSNKSSSMQPEHNYLDVYGCIEAGTSQLATGTSTI